MLPWLVAEPPNPVSTSFGSALFLCTLDGLDSYWWIIWNTTYMLCIMLLCNACWISKAGNIHKNRIIPPSQTEWLDPFADLQKLILWVIVDRAGDAFRMMLWNKMHFSSMVLLVWVNLFHNTCFTTKANGVICVQCLCKVCHTLKYVACMQFADITAS